MKHADRQAVTVEQTASRWTNGTWRIMYIRLSCSLLECRQLGTFCPRKLSARTPSGHKGRHGWPWHSPRQARVPLSGSPWGAIVCAAACVPLRSDARGPNGGGSPLDARSVFRHARSGLARMRCHSAFHFTACLTTAPSCGSDLPPPCLVSCPVLRVLFVALLSSCHGLSSCF